MARIRSGALLLIVAFAGCGGGVDSGGTGAPATSASGPITGFGSVIVNGVHFDDSRASITDSQGSARARDALKLGMIAAIRGSALAVDSTETRSTATSIVLSSALVGRADNIDTNARTVTVLSQTVEVKATTVFDDSLNGGLAALSLGDVVEIYALIDASSNQYSATRIERRTGVLVYELRGVVSSLNTSTRTFNIGGQRISYVGIPASDVPPALSNGRLVRCELQTTNTQGIRTATRLQDSEPVLTEQDEARFEGFITSVASGTQFNVGGVSVDASQAKIQGGGVGIGNRVAVEGIVRGGMLVATKVQIKNDLDVENEGFELDGTIGALDTAGKTFVLRGVLVDYSGNVEFRDGTIADLAAGKDVEVKGTLSGGGTGLRAVRIKFKH